MSQKFTSQQFNSYCEYQRPTVAGWYVGFGLVVLLFCILSVVLKPQGPTQMQIMLFGILTAAILFIIPISLGILWWIRLDRFSKNKEILLIDLFLKIGWERGVYAAIQDYPVVPSSIVHNLNPEQDWQFPRYMTFQGSLEGLPLECVFLDARPFVLDSKKAYLYLHIALPDSYPHTIVDGKDGLLRHDIAKQSNSVDVVKLEGGLDEFFNVYTIKDSGQNALYTLTPDIMEHLVDYGVAFNIEVIGNSLYVFSNPWNLEDAELFASFMNLAHYLAKEFNQRARGRGIRKGEFRYISDYAQNRMEISSTITGARGTV